MEARRRKGGMPAVAAVSAPFGRDLDECFARIERIVGRCRERGAELVVFPEATLGGYLYEPHVPSSKLGIAPPPELDLDGPEIQRLVEIAGPTLLCVGYTETGAYSSAV